VLLGKQAERARIERLLADARQGRGGTLVIRGEPGIGKTSLLRYAIDMAEAMTVVKSVGVEAEGELEYSGLIELSRPILSGLDGLPEHQAEQLRGALRLSAAPLGDRFTVGAALLALLAFVAERNPVLVVIDDAHWVDAASLDALAFAARRLAGDSVAFLVAARAGADAFGQGFEEIALEGLDPSSARRLLEHVAGDTVSAGVVERLVDATGGNPLALVELPRLLTEDQLAGVHPVADPVPVGAEVARAYSAATQRLPGATRMALLVLALSDSGEVALVSESLASSGGVKVLEPAEDVGLLDLVEGRFVFRHPLVRAAVVQSAAPSARREAHRALATALAEDEHERRAWHLAAAAVGPDDEAAQALANAGSTARERGGFEAATEAFERSARLTEDSEVREGRLADAANMAWIAGDSARTSTLVEEVLASTTDRLVQARLLQLRGRVELQTGTPEGARDRFVSAAELFEQDDPVAAAAALGLAVAACHHGGMMREGLALAKRSQTLAPRDCGLASRQTDYMLGRALGFAGYADEGAAILEPVLEQLLAEEDPGLQDLTRAALAAASLERDTESRELAERATRLARSQGPMALVQTLTLLAETCVRQGELQRATAAANEGFSLARDLGQPNVAVYFLQSLVRVEGTRGNEAACRAYAEDALPLIRASGVVLSLAVVQCALGLLELGIDDLEASVAILTETARTLEERGIFARDLQPEVDLVEALVRLGKLDDAQRVFDVWLTRGGRDGSPRIGALRARCRGLLAGDAEMEAAFEEALLRHASKVDPFGVARTHLCYGERLRRAGRRVDARAQLRAALQEFEPLEATAWIKRARRELRATGEKLGRRAAKTGDELTAQELQVALQVAEGKTNKEVGAALFLSPKTVEFHLARVYRKLDLASRGELIRHFAAAALPVLEPLSR
jgi:DNA-binding CsgD family transcriptional regulator